MLLNVIAILNKKRKNLIKEGLHYIDSWEEYIKDNSKVFKKYQEMTTVRLIVFSDPWHKHQDFLRKIKERTKDLDYIEEYDDMFKEIETYIDTFKPKVFLERENLSAISNIVDIINYLDDSDPQRLKYSLKCIPFFRIEALYGVGHDI